MAGLAGNALARSQPVPLDTLDWTRIAESLDDLGYADLGPMLTAEDCAALIALYSDDTAFRKRIVMRRHGYGEGEYKYFDYPLPPAVARLREHVYPHLAPIANRWEERLRSERRFPPPLEEMLRRCHAAGQARPTPLILKYESGDYNRLHQDLYGEQVFPLQLVILLSDPARDFEGGEFIVTEQRPRMQSRAEVVPLRQGHGVVFAVNERPRLGTRGYHRVKQRHGVSRLRAGQRYTLGIIFHDAA